MAYLLLWTIIERYVTIRYHLGGDNVVKKIHKLESDETFCIELKKVNGKKREIFKSDRPRTKVVLDFNNPKKAIDYYYQIRSNIVHRGKAAYNDYSMLYKSTVELLDIMQKTIKNTFIESETYIYQKKTI